MKIGAQGIVLAVCRAGAGCAEEILLEPGKKFFSPEVLGKLAQQLPEQKSLAIDLEALMTTYPEFCLSVELHQGCPLYLVMKNRAKIIYDDGRAKGFAEKLDKPDLPPKN